MTYVYAPHAPLVWSPAYTGNVGWMWTCNCGKTGTDKTEGAIREQAAAHRKDGS